MTHLGVTPDFTPDERAALRRLRARHLTAAGTAVALPVAAGATTLAVTWAVPEADTGYGVVVTSAWGTTAWVTDKATTGCTVHFGTAAPTGGGTVDLLTFRTE